VDTEQSPVDSEASLLDRFSAILSPQEAPAAEETEQPEVVAEQPETDDAPADEAVEAKPEDDGFVELELEDGETVRVPQKLKDGYLRQSDYTKKTQEAAILQRQAQSVIEQQAVVSRFQEETREDQRELARIEAEIERYKSVDWQSLDTDTFIRTKHYLETLKEQRNDKETAIKGKAAETQAEFQKFKQEQTKNAYEYIARHVKEWTPDSDTEKEVASFAQAAGITPEILAEVVRFYPAFGVFVHKAAQFDKLQSTKTNAVKKAQSAPPVVKPGAVTTSNAAQEQRYKRDRQELKKTGSTDALARLFAQRKI
jgi:hypothetical protein